MHVEPGRKINRMTDTESRERVDVVVRSKAGDVSRVFFLELKLAPIVEFKDPDSGAVTALQSMTTDLSAEELAGVKPSRSTSWSQIPTSVDWEELRVNRKSKSSPKSIGDWQNRAEE